MEKPELAQLLSNFYASAETDTNETYSKSAYVSIRAGINRYLTMPPYKRMINIMHDDEFKEANTVFKGKLRMNKAEKKDESTHHTKITRKDLKKMYNWVCQDLKDPQMLQYKVYLDLAFFLARRGREGLRDLLPQDFETLTNKNGRKYIQIRFNERKKKRQGDEPSVSRQYKNKENKNQMLEQPGSDMCPVKSFEEYNKRIWDCTSDAKPLAFFQRAKPKSQVMPDTDKEIQKWYNRIPVGKNPIGKWMSNISKAAGCSQIYTNHCMRNCTVTALHKGGKSLHQIAQVTDHSNYESLKSYLEKPDDEDREDVADTLFDYVVEPSQAVVPYKPPEKKKPEQRQTKAFAKRPVEQPRMTSKRRRRKSNETVTRSTQHDHPHGSPCWSNMSGSDEFNTPPESPTSKEIVPLGRRCGPPQGPNDPYEVRSMSDLLFGPSPAAQRQMAQQNNVKTTAPQMFAGATFHNCNISFGGPPPK